MAVLERLLIGLEKMPVRRPVPMKVPSVSKVSDIENAKIVTSTSGSLAGSENSEPKPSPVNRRRGLRQLREGLAERNGVAHGGQTHRDADDGGDDDCEQQAALDLEDREHDGEQQADEEQPQHRAVERGHARGGAGCEACRLPRVFRGEGDEVDVEQAHVGDEQADAAADRLLERFGGWP